MANALLATNYVAEAAIAINRIVKPGSSDRNVLQAAAATDALMGVINEVPAAINERIDVVKVGVAWVEAGAAFARGAPLTSDGVGRAIAAAPAAGSNVRVVGFAEEAATAAGDVVRFLISPCVMQG